MRKFACLQFSTSRALLENMPVVDVLTTNSLCVSLTSDVNIEVLARGTAGFSGRTELHVHVGSSLFEEGKRIVFWAGMSVNSRTHPVTNLLICSYAVNSLSPKTLSIRLQHNGMLLVILPGFYRCVYMEEVYS